MPSATQAKPKRKGNYARNGRVRDKSLKPKFLNRMDEAYAQMPEEHRKLTVFCFRQGMLPPPLRVAAWRGKDAFLAYSGTKDYRPEQVLYLGRIDLVREYFFQKAQEERQAKRNGSEAADPRQSSLF